MRNSWIHLSRGNAPKQSRVDVANRHEEHLSREGFFGPVAMLYHQRPTRDPVRVEGPLSLGIANLSAFKNDNFTGHGADDAATEVLYNDDVVISLVQRVSVMPYLLRNVDADTLYFVHEGTGICATEFGTLAYEPGDFILLPKGTTYRMMPSSPTLALSVESLAPIRLTDHKQIGRHSPVDPTVLVSPKLTGYDWPKQEEWELRLKHGRDFSSAFYNELPMDVTGWKGDLFPFLLNIRDIRPINADGFHLAPSAWAIFESDSFIGVMFQEMNAVSDPAAEELPARHRNVDTDEAVLMRRNASGVVNLLLHLPQGVTHGPMIEARERLADVRRPGMKRKLEAFSVDTFSRLHRTAAFDAAAKLGAQIPRGVG